MANCIVCQTPIPRGQRYQSPTHKNLSFCSEACYNFYRQMKLVQAAPDEIPGVRKLTDYILAIAETTPNWLHVMKQIKQIIKTYNFEAIDILRVVKYAHEYAGVEWDDEWGLYTFIPQYIAPMEEFREELQKNRELAESMDDDEVEVVKASRGNEKRWMKGDWEF